VLVIFSKILPGLEASGLQIIIAVALLIALNTVLSELLAKREVSWRSAATQFVVMGAANFAAVLIAFFLTGGSGDASFQLGNTVFLVGLLTLIVVLFDRYRDVGMHHRSTPELQPVDA
jgi:MFS family permease